IGFQAIVALPSVRQLHHLLLIPKYSSLSNCRLFRKYTVRFWYFNTLELICKSVKQYKSYYHTDCYYDFRLLERFYSIYKILHLLCVYNGYMTKKRDNRYSIIRNKKQV